MMTSILPPRIAQYVLRLSALVVVLVLTAAPGFAQDATTETTNRQLGPLDVTPQISWRTQYEENVYRSATQPISDIISTLSARTRVRGQLRRVGITASGSADWVHYTSLVAERGLNAGTALQVQLLFNRLTPYVRSTFDHTRDRINPEIDTRPRSRRADLTAGGIVRLAGKTSVDVFAGRSVWSYDETAFADGVSLGAALNRRSEQVGLSLVQDVTPLTRIMVTGELRRDLFDVASIRNLDNMQLTAGFVSDGRISGHASAGYRIHKPQDPALPEARGFLLNVGTSTTVRDRVQLSLNADGDLQPSYRPGITYYESYGYNTTVSYALRRSLRLSALVGQRYSNYGAGLATLLGEAGVDRETRYGTGINYRLGNAMSFTFAGIYQERASVVPVRRFDGINVEVGVSHAF